MHDKPKVEGNLAFYMVMLLFFVCLLGDLAALIFVTKIPWDVRLGLPFQIFTFYGITLGLLARSKTVKEVFDFSSDLSSPHPYLFVAGNLYLLALPMFISTLAISYRRKAGAPVLLDGLGCLAWILIIPILLLYTIFHFIVVMPVTYLGYIFASAVFARVQYSADEQIISSSANPAKSFNLREALSSDPLAAKSFILAILGALLSLTLKLALLFFK